MVDWFRIKWCITQVCKTIYFLFTKFNFQNLLFQRLFVHETWKYRYNMLIVLENSMRCIKYCKFPNNEYTHVQSSLWPQKNMVCLLWSPKPSCLRPGIYRHSGSWYFTQLSKSWYRKRKKARVFERLADNFFNLRAIIFLPAEEFCELTKIISFSSFQIPALIIAPFNA